ncbi:MAG: ChbG/HpnK family deacetylase [Bacteroidetes bacterium]|nr:ChbG/HpnK family deacetylase [Bacteroidota bacterium]
MMLIKMISFFFLFLSFISFAQKAHEEKTLLIRCDDIGMSHSVNLAAEAMIESGTPFSASVMFTCPWYKEAVDILKSAENISIGIHLTLNAEWKNYRWGPVSGANAVPSLVDDDGYFFPSRASLYENNPIVEEIEVELRAQIKRALNSGLQIDYVDYHMGTAVDKPEYRLIVEKLAREFNFGISRYFDEIDLPSMYSVPIPDKLDSLIYTVSQLHDTNINLLVCHIGIDNAELKAMKDMNTFGLAEMSKHRNAELNALLSDEFSEFIIQNRIRLITYKDLCNSDLIEMKRPVDIGY